MKPHLTTAAVLFASFALAACSGPPPQATGYQKTELLIMASMAGVVAIASSGSDSSSGTSTSTPVPTNIDRAPTYTPGSTHESYRLGDTESFYMAGCTGLCFRNIATDELLNILESVGHVYSTGIPFLHRRIEGEFTDRATILVPEPPRDVRQAWRDGWTGQGVNMLIVDEFGSASAPPSNAFDGDGRHGYTVLMSALEVAKFADYYALENGLGSMRYDLDYGEGGVRDASGARASASTKFHVVNHSFGNINRSPTRGAPSQEEVNEAVGSASFRDLLGSNQLDTADAVITKAAGNSQIDAGHFADNVALATHRSTAPRTLIVGALDGYARTSNPQNQPNIKTDARLASYSNHAGSNVEIQSRFLVEYGGTPYGTSAGLCDAAVPASQPCRNPQVLDLRLAAQGTSFSAPRVAGFAALVRSKFPSLSGAHTANILLETATTMGLACHTGTARKSASCARNIYGQGRVDIGAALAPIGSLR